MCVRAVWARSAFGRTRWRAKELSGCVDAAHLCWNWLVALRPTETLGAQVHEPPADAILSSVTMPQLQHLRAAIMSLLVLALSPTLALESSAHAYAPPPKPDRNKVDGGASPIRVPKSKEPRDRSGKVQPLGDTLAGSAANGVEPSKGLGPWEPLGGTDYGICKQLRDQAMQTWATLREATATPENIESWAMRVARCPYDPEVLRVAAFVQASAVMGLPADLAVATQEDLQETYQRTMEAHEKALRWIDAAIAEDGRRGMRSPQGTHYVRGRILLALGRSVEAVQALERSRAEGDARAYKVERMLALAAMVAGDLDQAFAAAWEASRYAAYDERGASAWVMALVLDRCGETEAALELARRIRNEFSDIDGIRVGVVGAALPPRERLYLAAFERAAAGDAVSATRLWGAMLRDDALPAEDRALVQRHIKSLEPRPVVPLGPTD